VRSRHLVIAGAALLTLIPAAMAAGPEPYIQEFTDGYIDWGRGFAGAWGKALNASGVDPSAMDPAIRRAAELSGRARLLAIVQRARANAEVRVGDRPDFVEKVKGIVRGAGIVKERTRPGNFYEALVEAPLYGVEGISYGIYEVMALKPAGASSGAPPPGTAISESAPNAPGGAGSSTAAPSSGASDAPTGIIIDARETGLAPALLPRIVDESGTVVSSPETVDPNALRDRGMAAYAKEPGSVSLFRERVGDHPIWVRASFALNPAGPTQAAPKAVAPVDPLAPRRGPRPYRLKAASAAGALKADVVLSKAEADKLESVPGGRNLLKDCRVLVIVESPVGGVEGVRTRPLGPWPRGG